jgi:HEAT repeat protein
MYDYDDLSLLNPEIELESPLDHLGSLTAESEASRPDPDAMLALLENPQTQQRMLAARAFCELEDKRATPSNSPVNRCLPVGASQCCLWHRTQSAQLPWSR